MALTHVVPEDDTVSMETLNADGQVIEKTNLVSVEGSGTPDFAPVCTEIPM